MLLSDLLTPDLNIGNTLANFKQLDYINCWNTKLISLLIIGAIWKFIRYSILKEILSVPLALFGFKLLMIPEISFSSFSNQTILLW